MPRALAEGDAMVADSARQGLALALTEIGTRVKICGDTAQCMAMYHAALDADSAYAVRAYPSLPSLHSNFTERGLREDTG